MFFQDIYDVTYCLWSHVMWSIDKCEGRPMVDFFKLIVICLRETVLTENLYIFISFLFIYYIYFARVTFSNFYFVSNYII